MTITNGYVTLAEFKANFFPAGSTDVVDDAVIEGKIEGASRMIDDHCGRHFYKSAAAESRYFTAEWEDLLKVDDLVSITTLKTDEDGDRVYEKTWTTGDYDLEPFNAALDGRPYTKIRVQPEGDYLFPTVAKSVEINGVWGWSAVPVKVKEACLIQAARLFKRKDAIFMEEGGGPFGKVKASGGMDEDAVELLKDYVKLDF